MKIRTAIICLFLVAILSLVVSAKNEDKEQKDIVAWTEEKAMINEQKIQANQTFGQCVSDAAEVKNTCYSATKDGLNVCKEQAADKQSYKTCKADYSKSMKECKASFKAAKKECGKIKHNFFDTLKASFK